MRASKQVGRTGSSAGRTLREADRLALSDGRKARSAARARRVVSSVPLSVDRMVLHVARERRWDGRTSHWLDRNSHWKGWGSRSARRTSLALDQKARQQIGAIRSILIKTRAIDSAVISEIPAALLDGSSTLGELPASPSDLLPIVSELPLFLSKPRKSRFPFRTPLSVDTPSRSANQMTRWHPRASRPDEPAGSSWFLLRRSEERMTRLSFLESSSVSRAARSKGMKGRRELPERFPESFATRPEKRATAPTVPVKISGFLARSSALRASLSRLHANLSVFLSSLSVFPAGLSVLCTRTSVLSATKEVGLAPQSTIPTTHS
jgi:hypothetical protein